MKALVLALALVGGVASASDPIVSKSSGGGYTLPEWSRWESCLVYGDHVDITKVYGSGPDRVELKERRDISLTASAGSLATIAAAEAVDEVENPLCDAPETTVWMGGAASEASVLFQTGGCGSPRKSRNGPASDALRAIVNIYCPTTYDSARRN